MATLAPPTPISFATRYRTDPVREALIAAHCDRFYVNERAKLVRNDYTTEFLCFKSDLDPSRKDYLDEKIRNVLAYTCAFYDIEELNALWRMAAPRKGKQPDMALALGLYLYFADECSRKHPNTTFLSEMRNAGLTYTDSTPLDRKQLYENSMRMLDSLGMTETHGHIFKEWCQSGSYTIQGHPHFREKDPPNTPDEFKPVYGAYARLARDIMAMKRFVPLNLAVSYALGNKEHIAGYADDNTAYAFTESLTGEEKSFALNKHIRSCIEKGDNLRRDRIYTVLGKLPPFKDSPSAEPVDDQLANRIFSAFSTPALEFLYRMGYNYAYSNSHNISTCYPEDPLPGLSQKSHETLQRNQGQRQSRYHIMFLSNGIRSNKAEVETYRELTIAQTMGHEMGHMFLSFLAPEEKHLLLSQVDVIHRQISELAKKGELPSYFDDKLKTLSYYTLRDTLDYKSFHYKNYRKRHRAEEMFCELTGLMMSEFPYPAPPCTPDIYKDIPALGYLAKQINPALERACDEAEKQFPLVKLPHQTTLSTGIAAAV